LRQVSQNGRLAFSQFLRDFARHYVNSASFLGLGSFGRCPLALDPDARLRSCFHGTSLLRPFDSGWNGLFDTHLVLIVLVKNVETRGSNARTAYGIHPGLEPAPPPSSQRPSSLRGTELVRVGQHSLALRRDADLELLEQDGIPEPHWHRPEWQQLWLSLEGKDWRTLALVPSGAIRPGLTVDVAVALVHTGSVHLGVPIRIADATDVALPHLRQFIEELTALRNAGDRVLVCLGGARSSATWTAIAQAADKALLCIELGRSKVSDAKSAIRSIGIQHFLGSAVFQK
jgi:hypothetical protein